MKRLWLALLTGAVGCGNCGTNPNGNDGGTDGGPVDTVPLTFRYTTLDSTQTDPMPFAIAVTPTGNLGVAYYTSLPLDAGTDSGADAGTEIHKNLKYVEYDPSANTATAPQPIPIGLKNGSTPFYIARNQGGVSLTYQPNGEPAVAYMGGLDLNAGFWEQGDAYLATRASGTTWTPDAIVLTSADAPGANAVDTTGEVVGMNPSLALDGGTGYLVYRDIHSGQFPTDFDGANLEIATGWGAGASWTKYMIIGSIGKLAYGSHSTVLLVGGRPAILGDQLYFAPDVPPGTSQNVQFIMMRSNGSWTAPKQLQTVTNTMLGPSFAYDDAIGFAYAVEDASKNTLYFNQSSDGVTWMTQADPVWAAGTGGWWPSLAVDPATHEPNIVFYFCDNRSGITSSCRTSDDELKLAIRSSITGDWNFASVDPNGGWAPKIVFLPTGRRAVVYRELATGALKVAVEQ